MATYILIKNTLLKWQMQNRGAAFGAGTPLERRAVKNSYCVAFLKLKKVLCASSYGIFGGKIEFWSVSAI